MTELDVYRQPSSEIAVPGAREIDSWIAVAEQTVQLAREICNTPFVPDGLRGSAPATAAAILAGRELGIGPMTALAHIHVIKGKPGLSAALMRALILSAGHEWRDVDVTDSRCVVEGRRRGETDWTRATFTADQARTARIDLGGYPQDKLYARATSRLARRKFADVIAGMPYSVEELEDGHDGEQPSSDTPAPPAAEQPKARTAQRRTAKTPAAEVTTPTPSTEKSPPQPPPQADLPPLPGEDDTDYDTPGTVTKPQLTKIAVVFGELGFAKDQRDDRLKLASRVVGRDLESSSDLSKQEASTLIDTIERCGCDYDKVTALLDAGDKPDE